MRIGRGGGWMGQVMRGLHDGAVGEAAGSNIPGGILPKSNGWVLHWQGVQASPPKGPAYISAAILARV